MIIALGAQPFDTESHHADPLTVSWLFFWWLTLVSSLNPPQNKCFMFYFLDHVLLRWPGEPPRHLPCVNSFWLGATALTHLGWNCNPGLQQTDKQPFPSSAFRWSVGWRPSSPPDSYHGRPGQGHSVHHESIEKDEWLLHKSTQPFLVQPCKGCATGKSRKQSLFLTPTHQCYIPNKIYQGQTGNGTAILMIAPTSQGPIQNKQQCASCKISWLFPESCSIFSWHGHCDALRPKKILMVRFNLMVKHPKRPRILHGYLGEPSCCTGCRTGWNAAVQ